jgi:hypothetical protein
MEQLVEWNLAGETEVLGENLPQRHELSGEKITYEKTTHVAEVKRGE